MTLRTQHRLADRIVFAKIRKRLGGRLRTPISGGAPLAQEIAEFFDGVGIRILEGYGLTECTTAATTNTPERWRFGTVGPALPGFELALAEDGELLIRSDTVFAGYFKDPDATAAVLDPDGWLHSGDIAEIDADGFVTITDRKKDILVTAGGKNIAPQNLENDLKASRFVSQAVVVGDRKPYVAALITLDPVEMGKWAAERDIAGGMDVLARDPRVHDLVQGIVDDVNRERSRFEQLKRFTILPRDFTMEHDEVTPTLKLKRRVVMEHFADDVDELYEADASRQAEPSLGEASESATRIPPRPSLPAGKARQPMRPGVSPLLVPAKPDTPPHTATLEPASGLRRERPRRPAPPPGGAAVGGQRRLAPTQPER